MAVEITLPQQKSFLRIVRMRGAQLDDQQLMLEAAGEQNPLVSCFERQLFWAPALPGRLPRLACFTQGERLASSCARQTQLQTVGCELAYLYWPGVPWAYWAPHAQAVCSVTGTCLRIYSWAADLEVFVQLPGTGGQPAPLLAWSPGSDSILHLYKGKARLVASETGQLLGAQRLWQPGVRQGAGLAWSSCGVVAVVSSSSATPGIGLYRLTPAHTMQLVRWLDTGRFATRLTFSPCGQLVAWVDHERVQPRMVTNVVRAAHVPSGRQVAVEELPTSCFELDERTGRPGAVFIPCGPLQLSADLYWQPDSSLLVVGPELGTTRVPGLARVWPIKRIIFGAPRSVLAALRNELLPRSWSYSLCRELVTFGVQVLAFELWSWRWTVLLFIGQLAVFAVTALHPFPHRWCTDLAVIWVLLRCVDLGE